MYIYIYNRQIEAVNFCGKGNSLIVFKCMLMYGVPVYEPNNKTCM